MRGQLLSALWRMIGDIHTPDDIKNIAIGMRDLLSVSHTSPKFLERIENIILDIEMSQKGLNNEKIGYLLLKQDILSDLKNNR